MITFILDKQITYVNDMLDKEKIHLCLEGNRNAQKLLYESYKVAMYVVCQRYFFEPDDAKDALQDGFVKVFRDLHQYDDNKGTLGSWIKKVMINTSLESLRKKKVDFSNIEDHKDIIGFESSTISDLQVKDLTKMIQMLPIGYRTVFNLYVIEGYNHQEIGDKLGISDSTSKTQLMKAKNLLRSKFEDILK